MATGLLTVPVVFPAAIAAFLIALNVSLKLAVPPDTGVEYCFQIEIASPIIFANFLSSYTWFLLILALKQYGINSL